MKTSHQHFQIRALLPKLSFSQDGAQESHLLQLGFTGFSTVKTKNWQCIVWPPSWAW